MGAQASPGTEEEKQNTPPEERNRSKRRNESPAPMKFKSTVVCAHALSCEGVPPPKVLRSTDKALTLVERGKVRLWENEPPDDLLQDEHSARQ